MRQTYQCLWYLSVLNSQIHSVSQNTEFSVLDLKARYRGAKYLHETLKILPKKPDTIVIEQIAQRLGSIGAIHQTQQKLNPG